jgi:hypothetical protein
VKPAALPSLIKEHEAHSTLEHNIIERFKPKAIESARTALQQRSSSSTSPDPWHVLGTIVENAVYLGIDPEMAADFVLEVCQDL